MSTPNGVVGSGVVKEPDVDVKDRKRRERLEQNRISARESRKRKKTMIEELQRTVITLSRENKELNERNEQLRRQLMEIGTKYPNIVPLQAIMGAGALGAAPPPPPQPNGAEVGHQPQAAPAIYNPMWAAQQQAAAAVAAAAVPGQPQVAPPAPVPQQAPVAPPPQDTPTDAAPAPAAQPAEQHQV